MKNTKLTKLQKAIIIVSSLTFIAGSTYIGMFLAGVFDRNHFNTINSEIKIRNDLEDFNMPLLSNSLKHQDIYEKDFIKKILKEHKKYFSYENQTNGGKNNILVFSDPITGIKFKDFSYGKDKNGRNHFYLQEEGLIYLANQFHHKVTYGPEVRFLKSININDFSIVDNNTKGLYIPNIQEMYINSFWFAEKNLSIKFKVQAIIPTIFHEYTHHWANCYAEIASKNDVSTSTFNFDKKDFSILKAQRSLWNPYFYNNFLSLLNYYSDLGKNIVYKQISGKYSLQQIFDLSNHKNEEAKKYRKQLLKHKKTYFSNIEYESNNIPYYYSLAELIPREWQKTSYKPYYSLKKIDNNFNETEMGFDNKKYTMNWTGLYENDKHIVSIFSNALDWSRTYNLRLLESTPFIHPISSDDFRDKNLFYPNTIFEGKINNTNLSDRKHEFFQIMLNTMGYGRTISQIYSEISYKWNNKNSIYVDDKKLLNNIAITGYLNKELKDAKKIVFKNKKGKNVGINIYKQNFWNYTININNIADNCLLPEDTVDPIDTSFKNVLPYYSEYFNVAKLDIDYSKPIALWVDNNNDNIMDASELKNENLTIFTQRAVTPKRVSWHLQPYENITQSNIWKTEKTFSIIEKDNSLYLNKEFE